MRASRQVKKPAAASRFSAVDEGRKRVIGIMAAILGPPHMQRADDLSQRSVAAHGGVRRRAEQYWIPSWRQRTASLPR